MGIAGVGGYQYPNYYGVQNSGRNSGEVFGATCTEQVAPTNLILHGDSDEYGKVYGALGFPDGSNTAVYKSKEYTAENPVFLVAAWDADGNKTETKIDASKVDPASASLQEMMALNANRIINGQDDFGNGLMMSAGGLHGDDTLGGYEDFFAKTNWIAEMEESMNTQFMLGNYDGYLRYKKAYDIMQSISDELVNIGSEDEKNKTNDYTKLLEESARKVKNQVENRKTEESEERNQKVVEGKATDTQLQELLKDNNERRFDLYGPNASEDVKQAWMNAAKETGIEGLGMSTGGMLNHITQLDVQMAIKRYNGEEPDVLGSTVGSAMQAIERALYDLEHPLESNNNRSASVQESIAKEKEFYERFLENLKQI